MDGKTGVDKELKEKRRGQGFKGSSEKSIVQNND